MRIDNVPLPGAGRLARRLGTQMMRAQGGVQPHWEEALDASLGNGELYEFDRLRRAELAWGWALGVLSAGLGNDLLLDRRERRGLHWITQALGTEEQLRGVTIEELPELPSVAGAAWKISYLWAQCVLRASTELPLCWELREDDQRCTLRLQIEDAEPPWELSLGPARSIVKPPREHEKKAWGTLQFLKREATDPRRSLG